MGPSACLDERTVVAFLEGDLATPERSVVEGHLDSCSSCTDLLTWAAAEHAHGSRAAPGNEGRPYIGRLPPGARIDRYQILAAVGRGGMGEVYAAYHPDLDRRIALKVVNESGAGAPERRARLLREARAIARLSHPNVITVHDAGTMDDRVYIAMEFVEGKTIDEWRRAQARGWREILAVFVAAARGLAAAHAAGVVHRDFKPQNVMIGRDGSVRVMDFGLARLAEEPVDPPDVGNAVDARPVPATVTKTGALVGTLAYMAPEQYRGEPLDARADQFSFCVALHEALYGSRPVLSHLRASTGPSGADADASQPSRRSGAPAWLRNVIVRGMSEDRSRRFPSMDALLAAVGRGQTRVRTRAAVLGIGAAVLLLSLGGWRLAAGRHVSCAVPLDRLAAVWPPGDEANPRRQAIHRAFAASGRPTAEAAWQRVAKALDDYTTQWSAMHIQNCEATHVRGEQSSEVLDLRMGCLTETLDEARALTEVLSRADGAMLSQAVMAASNLTPLSRCADIPALRSAVPPPRDEKTARTVDSLRRSLRDAAALEEVGNERDALQKAREILQQTEATGYKPLLAEVLFQIGVIQMESAPREARIVSEKALYAAEASRDDITAAKACSSLVAVGGVGGDGRDRHEETDRWANLAHAILDRIPSPQKRIRAWVFHNQGFTRIRQGDAAAARPLYEQALALKEAALGKNHPDVGRTTSALVWVMTELGHPEEALRYAARTIEICGQLDPDGIHLGYALNNRGEALNALSRYGEAEKDYLAALPIMRAQFGPTSYKVAYPIQGLGEARLAQGDPAGAVRYFEEALSLREGQDPEPLNIADTHFALARALTATGKDPNRARTLAAAAHGAYASHDARKKRDDVIAWLEAHKGSGR